MRFNSDLTTHSSTKPVDVSLEGENPNIATQVRSAVLSHRVNAKKIKYYRLDLTIGTLKFTNHPLFCEEDHLAVSL